jgi:hypothetical protein
MMPRFCLLAVLCATAVALTACTRTFDMWVMSGSTADNLVFGIELGDGRKPMLLASVRVVTCDSIRRRAGVASGSRREDVVWSSTSAALAWLQPATRITYGKDEHGLHTEAGSSPLIAGGCYHVDVYARDQAGGMRHGSVGFNVDEHRTIREMSGREHRRFFKGVHP